MICALTGGLWGHTLLAPPKNFFLWEKETSRGLKGPVEHHLWTPILGRKEAGATVREECAQDRQKFGGFQRCGFLEMDDGVQDGLLCPSEKLKRRQSKTGL